MAAAHVPKLRVAVLGAGIGGCSAAANLRKLGAQVTLIEMGRGVGGRAATRRTRQDKRFEVNHGSPAFEIMTPEGLHLAQELTEQGYIEPFTAPVGRLKAGGDSLMPEDTQSVFMRYSGRPTLDRLCEGLIEGFGITTRFGIMARTLEAIRSDGGNVTGWRLFDSDKALIDECDWLLISGSTLAHPRWTTIFGGTPPLMEVAVTLNDPKLTAALAVIGAMGARPVQTVFMGFEGDAAEAWSVVPFAIAEIEGDDTIAKVNIQRRNGMVFVVAHSTHEFAQSAQDAMGSTGSTARVTCAAANAAREQEVLAELLKGLQRCMAGLIEDLHTEAAAFGPFLHRWGNAFPDGDALSLEEACVPDSRIIFAGDFVGQRSGSIEGALLSGAAAAEQLRAHAKL